MTNDRSPRIVAYATPTQGLSIRAVEKWHFQRRQAVLEAAHGRQDPRVERTRGILWATLVDLIDEAGYSAITVREITTRAKVNRTTFYRHYEDKDDLFRQGCSELFNTIFLKLRRLLDGLGDTEPKWMPEYFVQMFVLIDAERKVLTVVGGPGSNPEFRQIMTEKIDAFIIEERFKPFTSGMGDPALAELYASSLSSIVIGLTTRWLSNPELFTLEQVSEVYRTVITSGIRPYSRLLAE